MTVHRNDKLSKNEHPVFETKVKDFNHFVRISSWKIDFISLLLLCEPLIKLWQKKELGARLARLVNAWRAWCTPGALGAAWLIVYLKKAVEVYSPMSLLSLLFPLFSFFQSNLIIKWPVSSEAYHIMYFHLWLLF